MSVKIFIISNFLILNFAFAQSVKEPDSTRKLVKKIISNSFPSESLKDSTAFYAGTITIKVVNKKGRQLVDVNINNQRISSVFIGENELKKLNYNGLMRRRSEATFIFKVCLLVHNSKYEPALIDLYDVEKSIFQLVEKDKSNFENIGFIMMVYDKKIYH